MSVDLPISQDASEFSFPCELEGVTYTFDFRWNDREGAWHMRIGDANGNPIATCTVLINIALFRASRDPRLPTGVFMAFDTSAGGESDPGFADLGRRVIVTYATAAEIAATGV